MANCKQCNEAFHACGSCGLSDREYSFCNDNCYEKYQENRLEQLSKKYDIKKDVMKKILEEGDYYYAS